MFAVIDHFDNPKVAIGIEVDRDGALDQRLTRNELDLVAWQDFDRTENFIDRAWSEPLDAESVL